MEWPGLDDKPALVECLLHLVTLGMHGSESDCLPGLGRVFAQTCYQRHGLPLAWIAPAPKEPDHADK